MSQDSIEKYFESVTNIVASSESVNQENFTEEIFTAYMADILIEAGEAENPEILEPGFKIPGYKVNGSDINSLENQIDIYVTDFNNQSDSIQTITTTLATQLFRQGEKFLTKSLDESILKNIDEAETAYYLSKQIYSLKSSIKRARIIIISNGRVGKIKNIINKEDHNGIAIEYEIWDIERAHRFDTLGKSDNPVSVNFLEEFGEPLKCLYQKDKNNVYTAFTGFISGDQLYSLYDKWGTRLLERNVRAYLQNRGNVNKGIRNTIKDEPELFLAFNNGLTITADNVKIKFIDDQQCQIEQLTDFQIVNGGQTCASIWHAREQDKTDISDISVLIKLTVVNEKEKINEIAPKISEYSNSQNKVNPADFRANDPFHVNLGKLSREHWTPELSGGLKKPTKWFYDRSRGSYEELKRREKTPAKIREFKALFPTNQKFDKPELGKSEMTWQLYPHLVCRGPAKNFRDFTKHLNTKRKEKIDTGEYERYIARLILWKAVDKLILRHKMHSKQYIIAYTLAWFYHLTERKINLKEIWNQQSVDSMMLETLDHMAHTVRERTEESHENDSTALITEWYKKEQCWKSLKKEKYSLPEHITSKLLDTSSAQATRQDKVETKEDKILIDDVSQIPGNVWYNISHWGKVTDSLKKWETGISFSLGKLSSRGQKPSKKQAIQGERIYKKAMRLGYNPKDADIKK